MRGGKGAKRGERARIVPSLRLMLCINNSIKASGKVFFRCNFSKNWSVCGVDF